MSDELNQEPPPVAQPTAPPAPTLPPTAALTPLAQRFLVQTRPWARFMSIVVFATVGLMLLLSGVMLVGSVFGSLAGRGRGELGPLGGAVQMGFMFVAYVALAALYAPAGLYLFRYASAIGQLERHASAAGLEDALRHQRSFWRYVGILTIVGLILTVLLFALAIVIGVATAGAAARRV